MPNESKDVFILEPETVDRIAALVADALGEYKTDPKDILRIRLITENILLRIAENCGESRQCSFSVYKRFGSGQIRLVFDGVPYNPLEDEDDELTGILLKNLGVPCTWKYINQRNVLVMFLSKRKKSTVPALLAAIAAAGILGYLSQWVPAGIRSAVSSYFLLPFKNAYLGLLGALAGILIFFNILTGLCGDKETRPLGEKSKRMFLRMPLMLTAVTTAGYVLLFLFSNVSFHAPNTAAESQAGRMAELLWGLVPDNILAPFLNGNYIHILILAFLFGTVLSAIRDQHAELVASINGINRVVTTATAKICRFIPLFVFCCLLNLVMSPEAKETLRDIWKPVVWFLGVSAVMITIVLIGTAIRLHCGVFKLLKTILPAVLICLTTASPIAAYSTNLQILEDRFGVSQRFSRVSLSVSSKIYGPGCVLYLAVMVVYFTEKYGIPVNFGWFLTAVLMTVLLTFACPPIPGGMLIIFGVLCKQFGFPEECLVILATADVVLDGLSGAVSCALRNPELLLEANKYGELDKQILERL